MLLSVLFGLIGIVILTVYCLLGAFAAPQIAYWTMTPKVKEMLEDAGISRKFERKNIILLTVLTFIILAGFLIVIWYAFTRTRIFGILLQKKTGKEPPVWSVEPQWDGKEIYKLIIEAVISVIMAWVFLKKYG